LYDDDGWIGVLPRRNKEERGLKAQGFTGAAGRATPSLILEENYSGQACLMEVFL